MKKIYIHTSYLDNKDYFESNESFECVSQYDYYNTMRANRNELGRIKVGSYFLHILIGKLLNKNCPWCNSVPVFKKKQFNKVIYISIFQFYMECPNCGSTGPKKTLTIHRPDDKLLNDEIENMIKQLYGDRIPWERQAEIKMDD